MNLFYTYFPLSQDAKDRTLEIEKLIIIQHLLNISLGIYLLIGVGKQEYLIRNKNVGI
jgi:hypothetical protein